MGDTKGQFSRAVSITGPAKTLIELGFTSTEVGRSNSAHITVYGAVLYDYVGNTPAAANSGHYIEANGDRIIEGRGNLDNLRLIAVTGTVAGYITLGSS